MLEKIPPDLTEKAIAYFLSQIVHSQRYYKKILCIAQCCEKHPTKVGGIRFGLWFIHLNTRVNHWCRIKTRALDSHSYSGKSIKSRGECCLSDIPHFLINVELFFVLGLFDRNSNCQGSFLIFTRYILNINIIQFPFHRETYLTQYCCLLL